MRVGISRKRIGRIRILRVRIRHRNGERENVRVMMVSSVMVSAVVMMMSPIIAAMVPDRRSELCRCRMLGEVCGQILIV